MRWAYLGLISLEIWQNVVLKKNKYKFEWNNLTAFGFFAPSVVFRFFCLDVVFKKIPFCHYAPIAAIVERDRVSRSPLRPTFWQLVSNGNFDIWQCANFIEIDWFVWSNCRMHCANIIHIPYTHACTNPSNVQIDLLPLKRHSHWEQICHLKLFKTNGTCKWRLTVYSHVSSNLESVWEYWASWLCYWKVIVLLLFIMFACQARLYECGEQRVKEKERHPKIRSTEHKVINLSIKSA